MYFIYDNPLYQKESDLTGWLSISNRNFLEIPPSYVSDSFQARFQINFDVELPIKLTLISRWQTPTTSFLSKSFLIPPFSVVLLIRKYLHSWFLPCYWQSIQREQSLYHSLHRWGMQWYCPWLQRVAKWWFPVVCHLAVVLPLTHLMVCLRHPQSTNPLAVWQVVPDSEL